MELVCRVYPIIPKYSCISTLHQCASRDESRTSQTREPERERTTIPNTPCTSTHHIPDLQRAVKNGDPQVVFYVSSLWETPVVYGAGAWTGRPASSVPDCRPVVGDPPRQGPAAEEGHSSKNVDLFVKTCLVKGSSEQTPIHLNEFTLYLAKNVNSSH